MLTNVAGTDHLLRLAERAGARFVLSSTSEVYGDPETHPQHGDYGRWVSCTGPRARHDEGRRAAETMTFDFARMRRARVRAARIFNSYWPHMHPDDGRVVSNLICQAFRGTTSQSMSTAHSAWFAREIGSRWNMTGSKGAAA